MSKRGKDTEWDASHGMEEIREFCFKEFAAVCLFWNFFVSGIPVILLIKAKHYMLIATILSYICLVLKRDNGSVIGVVDVLLDLVRL